MIRKVYHFCQGSIRNKLMVVLPVITALFLLFPNVLSIFALRMQLTEHLQKMGEALPEIQNALLTQTITLILISILGIGSMVILIIIMAYSVTEPIATLAKDTEQMAQGKRDLKPLPHEGPDEVGTLAKSINHFIAHIDKMEQEKSKDAALIAIGRMSAELAHEIRNPLGGIDLFCQLFEEKWQEEKFRNTFVRTVPRELDRIKNLVNGLLEVARPVNLQFRTVNAKKLLLQVLPDFKNGGSVKLNVDLDEGDDVSWEIVADEYALVRVFKNIIQNAVQAMHGAGSLTISLKKIYDEQDNTDRVELVFKDTGPGMDEKTLERIFEPFFTGKQGGTGLGLAICKKIVDGHNGAITVDSKLGQGTTFYVELPVRNPNVVNAS